MKTNPFVFPSATGVCDIHANAFIPDGEYDTVVVIHHGMAEHQKRYEPFIRFLCGNGAAAYIHDMANHGSSNTDVKLLGWFGEKDGWLGLIADFREMVLRAQKENPGKKLIVMGHSMGAFICQLYTSRHPEDGFDGAIYMGTGGPNPALGAGKAAAAAIGALAGKKHKSKLLAKMAFGAYSQKFEHRTEYDWLTRETSVVDKYVADPYCGYLFTVQGMHDLIEINSNATADSWFRDLPAELPVLLVSGELDPVGGYGKGVGAVAEKLKATGHTRVTLRVYPDCRHEVLNELNRDRVMEDILAWIREI